MEFRELSRQDIAAIYGTRMQSDFPQPEIKPLELLLRRYDEGMYFARGLYEGDQLLSYALFFKAGGFVLLDYFAVDARLRGGGIGSRTLRCIGGMPELGSAKLLLEVEDPDFAQDSDDKAKRLRRIDFYTHADVLDTGMRSRVFDVDYRILSPGGLPASEAGRGIETIYRALLPAEVYEANVILK